MCKEAQRCCHVLLPWTDFIFGNVLPWNGLLGDTAEDWITQSKTAKLIGSCYGEHPLTLQPTEN